MSRTWIRRVAAVAVVAVGLALAACNGPEELGPRIVDEAQQAVDSASRALADLEDEIDAATRPILTRIESGVESVQEGIEEASDKTGDEARRAYEELNRRAAELRARADAAADQAIGRGAKGVGTGPGRARRAPVEDPGPRSTSCVSRAIPERVELPQARDTGP